MTVKLTDIRVELTGSDSEEPLVFYRAADEAADVVSIRPEGTDKWYVVSLVELAQAVVMLAPELGLLDLP